METKITKKIFNWYLSYGYKIIRKYTNKNSNELVSDEILNIYNQFTKEEKERIKFKKVAT